MTSFELFYLGCVLGFGIPAITYWGYLFIKSYNKTKPPVDHPHNRADGIQWDSVRKVTDGCNENVHHVSLYEPKPYDTLYKYPHIHVLETNKCIKNRYGPRC